MRTPTKKINKLIAKKKKIRVAKINRRKNSTGGKFITPKRVLFIKDGGGNITDLRVGGETSPLGGGVGVTNTIYNADDTLTANRNVNMADKNLSFLSNGGNFAVQLGTPGVNPVNYFGLGSGGLEISSSDIAGLKTGINITDEIIVRDSLHNVGAKYIADYSANFVDESLVSKRYVDNAIAGVGGGNIYSTDGTLAGARIVDAGNNDLSFTNNASFSISGGNALFRVFSVADAVLMSSTAGTLEISDTARFSDIRSAGSQRGLEYSADYSADFLDRSLVDKAYVDNAIAGIPTPTNEWTKNGTELSPTDSNIDVIRVEKDFNGYSILQLVNGDDAGNGAGAVLELKGSGADYTNNLYFGKYGAGFWIPELAGNGALMTDKSLVIGSVDTGEKTRFISGNSYTNINVVAEFDELGFAYLSDLSAGWTDRHLVDKGYVDSKTSKLDFITVTQAVDLDQMETDLNSLADAMFYRGDWDASTGSFPAETEKGGFYIVSVAGTVDNVDFEVNDVLISEQDNPSVAVFLGNWKKLSHGASGVTSVFGRTGDVVAQAGDYNADQITETANSKIFTAIERAKLASIEDGAEVNVQADWDETNSGNDAFILNKPALHKDNTTTTPPTVNDDDGLGYEVGSHWYDTATNTAWVCLDNTTGSANWEEVTNPEHRFENTVAPTPTDDENDGYVLGDLWIDTTNDNAFVLVDGTAGSAIWKQIDGGGGGGAVDSVFGRVGTVTAQNGDYNAGQISETATEKIMTGTERTKLAGIENGAEVNVQSDWSQIDNAQDDFIKNKPTALSEFTNDMGFVTADDQTASEVNTDTANFDNNLSSADDTVQKALDKLDDLNFGAGAFESVSQVIRESAGVNQYDQDFVVGSPQLDDDGDSAHDSRMFFDKSKSAFRAGSVSGTEWDDANVGNYSVAMGRTMASGAGSIALGQGGVASNSNSVALGGGQSSGQQALAVGNAICSGDDSVALGKQADVSGWKSFGFGEYAIVNGSNSVAIVGVGGEANGTQSTALGGNGAHALGDYSVVVGNVAVANGNYSFIFGQNCETNSHHNMALGNHANADKRYMQTYSQAETPDNSQTLKITMYEETTDGNNLKLKYGDALAYDNIQIQQHSSYRLELKAVARQVGGTAGTTGDSASFKGEALLHREGAGVIYIGKSWSGNAIPTEIEPEFYSAGANSWVIAEDNSLGLGFKARGEANKTIRWTIELKLIEVE